MILYKSDILPELAQSWETSPDGLNYTIKLVKNAKFHNTPPVNGRPFTAKDVLANFQRDATTGLTTNHFDEVDKITAPDDYTVQIKLKRPYAEFLYPLASRVLPIYPIELADQGLMANGKNVAIGTGPLIYDRVDGNRTFYFKANADYFD